ncbi:MAG: hypothetical protein LLF97_02680 [Planctomycetaceae bacterium]|nr:hypothetical protein [Planctomycetaceae bacterium]
MSELAFSPAVQHWVNVVLIWVGFGTVAGLLATVLLPLRRTVGPFQVVVMGILGSTLGLLGLSWLYPKQSLQPISVLGLLAASVGAFALLILYHIWGRISRRREDESEP